LKGDGQLAPAAFKLSVQEQNSDPVQVADGFYILHLAGVTEARPLTLEEGEGGGSLCLEAEVLQGDSRVAGWNVGIASWRTGGRVINLDGLANAEVVQSITSGRLACYLSAMHVTHLMDYGFMFPGRLDPQFSRKEGARRQQLLERYGYDVERLYRCTTVAVAATDAAFPLSTYRLFAIDQDCVAKLCPLK